MWVRWPQKALPAWIFQSCLTRAYPHSLRKTPANKNDRDIYATYRSLLDMPWICLKSLFHVSSSKGCCIWLHRLYTAQLQALL